MIHQWLTGVLILLTLLPVEATAQDLEAVDKALAKCVQERQLTLRQASAMMQTLRGLMPKESEETPITPRQTGPRREGFLPDRQNRGPDYSKFDLIDRSGTLDGLVERALHQRATLRFQDADPADVVDSIAKRLDLPMKFKPPKGVAAGAAKTVSIDVSGVSLRSALRLAFAPLKLTYVIEDEVLWIMSQEEARKILKSKDTSGILSKPGAQLLPDKP